MFIRCKLLQWHCFFLKRTITSSCGRRACCVARVSGHEIGEFQVRVAWIESFVTSFILRVNLDTRKLRLQRVWNICVLLWNYLARLSTACSPLHSGFYFRLLVFGSGLWLFKPESHWSPPVPCMGLKLLERHQILNLHHSKGVNLSTHSDEWVEMILWGQINLLRRSFVIVAANSKFPKEKQFSREMWIMRKL